MVMKNFNFIRFGRVLKLDFAQGFKSMMWGSLCMLMLFLFYFWFAHNIGYSHVTYNSPDLFPKYISEGVGMFSMPTLCIFFLVVASMSYRAEQKKQKRIAWLMLPATNLEKFLSHWVYMLVYSLVGGLLMFLLADGLHILYLKVTGMPVFAASSTFFASFPQGDRLPNLIAIYAFMTTVHAFYLLGSVFFKRFHFIATSAVFVLFMSLMIVDGHGRSVAVSQGSVELFEYFLVAFQAWMALLFTWLSYRLFCRWQVVTHKFANI